LDELESLGILDAERICLAAREDTDLVRALLALVDKPLRQLREDYRSETEGRDEALRAFEQKVQKYWPGRSVDIVSERFEVSRLDLLRSAAVAATKPTGTVPLKAAAPARAAKSSDSLESRHNALLPLAQAILDRERDIALISEAIEDRTPRLEMVRQALAIMVDRDLRADARTSIRRPVGATCLISVRLEGTTWTRDLVLPAVPPTGCIIRVDDDLRLVVTSVAFEPGHSFLLEATPPDAPEPTVGLAAALETIGFSRQDSS
jgi:hypothetical protein